MKTKKQHLSDEEIIELYWKRNEDAIQQTDVKYGKYLFTIAYNIVHDRLDSEECLNDTYLGTWNKIPPERPLVFNVFLSRIMRNVAINRYKKNNAAKRVPQGLIVPLEELGDTLGVGCKMGEGWLLTAEMCELIDSGVPNIVCVQPFGCLPNHIAGKGTIRALREKYPRANIVPIDYDPGATRVNQENRLKLMLAVAREEG